MTEEKKIATILYNMSLDMDWADYEEMAEEEIGYLSEELQLLKEKDSPLFYILETIAESNKDMEDWRERQRK